MKMREYEKLENICIPEEQEKIMDIICAAYIEWDRYTDGHGGSSLYKVIAWMPIPTYKENENG